MSKSTSLLLLPASFSSLTVKSLSTANKTALTAAISSIKSNPFETEILVAIDWDFLHTPARPSNVELLEVAHEFLRYAYNLIYNVCIDIGVDKGLAPENEMHVRIILLDCSDTSTDCHSQKLKWPLGPIFQLESLVATQYSWNSIFSTEDEAGKKLLEQYRHVESLFQDSSHPKPSLPIIQIDTRHNSDEDSQQLTIKPFIAVAGCFDHLHLGHKYLLTATLLLLQLSAASSHAKLIIGIIAEDETHGREYSYVLQSWEQRYKGVLDFVLSLLPLNFTARQNAIMTVEKDYTETERRILSLSFHDKQLSIECVEFRDGSFFIDGPITDVIFATSRCKDEFSINRRRERRGAEPVEIHVIDYIKAHEADHKISSSRIRKGILYSDRWRTIDRA